MRFTFILSYQEAYTLIKQRKVNYQEASPRNNFQNKSGSERDQVISARYTENKELLIINQLMCGYLHGVRPTC